MRWTGVARVMTCVAIALILAFLGRTRALAADDVAALNKQALQFHSQGRYQEAAVLAEKALALAENTLGAEHPHTLIYVNNLGFMYKAQGLYDKAGPLYRRAL